MQIFFKVFGQKRQNHGSRSIDKGNQSQNPNFSRETFKIINVIVDGLF